MAPLLGMMSLLCGLFFLFGMPVIAAFFAWEYRRLGKLPTGFLVSVVMIVVFYASAGLIWHLGTTDWNLSFLTTLEASVDAEKYGHPVEHRAETMVVWLLIYSTFTAVVAGVVTPAVRRAWRRRKRLPA